MPIRQISEPIPDPIPDPNGIQTIGEWVAKKKWSHIADLHLVTPNHPEASRYVQHYLRNLETASKGPVYWVYALELGKHNLHAHMYLDVTKRSLTTEQIGKWWWKKGKGRLGQPGALVRRYDPIAAKEHGYPFKRVDELQDGYWDIDPRIVIQPKEICTETIQPQTTVRRLNMQLVTTKELASFLRLSTRQIHYLKKDGLIPYYKINKSTRYDINAVTEALSIPHNAGGTVL
jgi:hypothetical protein